MSDETKPAPKSEHFKLHRKSNAYGETLIIPVPSQQYNELLLLQPWNPWAAEHFDQTDNERRLLRMLEYAYHKGYAACQAQIRKDLGIL